MTAHPPRPGLLRRLRWRRIGVGALAGVLLVVAWSFPFGPLFPLSPWKPGYAHLALARADVYYPAGRPLPEAFRHVDEYIADAEAFHRMTVTHRVTVILCRDWNHYVRLLPHLRGARIGGAALLTGTVIYITPRVAERGFDHGEFLRHEISHATLHQHQTLWQAYRALDAAPFYEGLAVSFGRQQAYVTPAEFVTYADSHELGPIVDSGQRRPGLPWNMRVNYQAWRYFLEYEIETRGRDRFQDLLVGSIDDPAAYASIFARVYRTSLADAVQEFERDLRGRRWLPQGHPLR